ncbi:condensin complex subunit 2/barren [Butyriboletus roseoflavus]|nr:condensin complex subunit 2/barren [Butyriboletus roseoflavus]
MAPSKHARIAEHDSDDTEPDTPRPNHRQGSKKRISDVHGLDPDASFNSDSGRAPLRTVNINDDAAEKRRRRKTTKLAVIESVEPGPSSGDRMDTGESSRAALAKQKHQQQLNSALPPPVINVPLDVMNSNFEEWMKMATDNKINAANSWNFALIDYFHDMSLLRNNTDNSINFQRASCTLDGCVKIWTSRVDSVGTETGKLLSNLANENMATGEEADEAASDDPDGQDASQPRKKKKTHRPDSTLAKDASQLRSKKLDLEFRVDPLFKKTCADFDEGGAHGLLMNHLGLGVGADGGLRIVFDASDSMAKVVDEEESILESEEDVDLSYLRSHFLPDLEILEDNVIAHSLAEFSFTHDNITFDDTTLYRDDTRADEEDDDGNGTGFDAFGDNNAMDVDGSGIPQTEDFFQGDQTVDDDYACGGAFGGDDYGSGHDGSPVVDAQQGQNFRPGAFVPFDPRRIPTERDLVMAMTDADGESGIMGYFDQNIMKNWAGPEHWKLRKVIRKPDASEGAASKPRREKKEAFRIDFLTPSEKDVKTLSNELFAPVTRGAGITLPNYGTVKSTTKKGGRGRKAKEEKRDTHTLPDDMHFSSRQLVTLFLKPKFSLKMRGQRVRFNEAGDGEVDENFWAQAAADQAAGRLAQEEGDESGDVPVPFNTQFFNDDDDGPAFDDLYEGDVDVDGIVSEDAGEQDLLAATQGMTRRIRPESVNYAKRAKRVDVRKLKENIWKGLDIKVSQKEEQEEEMDVDDQSVTDPSDGRQFSQVISGLQKSYPKDKMEEISTSFCFICLLHLANEQGLKLQASSSSVPDDDGGDEVPTESQGVDRVADIWNLKVFRDPNATPGV